MGLLDMLNQAMANNNDHSAALDQVAQSAPPDVLSQGLAAAFRSDQTPALGNMVGQMFGQSNGQQQAGVLNTILGSLGPAAASALAGGVLGRMIQPGQTQITPDQASQLSPSEVAEVVNHAQQSNPAVTDQIADFYANHRGLINTIGGLAASVALMKMKDHMTNQG